MRFLRLRGTSLSPAEAGLEVAPSGYLDIYSQDTTEVLSSELKERPYEGIFDNIHFSIFDRPSNICLWRADESKPQHVWDQPNIDHAATIYQPDNH